MAWSTQNGKPMSSYFHSVRKDMNKALKGIARRGRYIESVSGAIAGSSMQGQVHLLQTLTSTTRNIVPVATSSGVSNIDNRWMILSVSYAHCISKLKQKGLLEFKFLIISKK